MCKICWRRVGFPIAISSARALPNPLPAFVGHFLVSPSAAVFPLSRRRKRGLKMGEREIRALWSRSVSADYKRGRRQGAPLIFSAGFEFSSKMVRPDK